MHNVSSIQSKQLAKMQHVIGKTMCFESVIYFTIRITASLPCVVCPVLDEEEAKKSMIILSLLNNFMNGKCLHFVVWTNSSLRQNISTSIGLFSYAFQILFE